MEMIKHFSHRHRLTLYEQKCKKRDQMTCCGCGEQNWSDFYGCPKCNYDICKSCSGLPTEIRHPFHNEHPLTLLPGSPYEESSDAADSSDESAYCAACSMICDGFIFHCLECDFDLDVNCATLMPTTSYYRASEQQTHPHPLIPCDRTNKQVDFSCSVCKHHIKGTIYACLDCGAILHESCTQLPQQITHHFHPHHSLTLIDFDFDVDVSRFANGRCEACGVSGNRFFYTCSDSPCSDSPKFDLDVRCASLMPKSIIMNSDDQNLEGHQEVVQVPPTHPHDLIQCDININTKGNFSFVCSACQLSIEDTVYVCLQCLNLLHKTCAELPLEIEHPFHPPHPLVLNINYRYRDYDYRCQACKCSVLGYRYCCVECQFEMDVTCASLPYSTLKFELHQHPLAYFDENKRYKPRLLTFTEDQKASSVFCSCCKILQGFPFFRCVPCDFSIKLCCLSMLPHIFKHSNHQHSLTLTYSHIKDHSDDDNDSKYYCDICEEIRNLWEPTYYCEDCHYVAHTSCVFHEILPLLGRKWPLARNEEIVMLQAKVDALSMKIETLTPKLNELKERRAHAMDEHEIKWCLANGLDDKNDALVTEVVRINASPTLETLRIEIRMLQNEVDALTKKLEMLTTKLDELKGQHSQYNDGYQIGKIPSFGTKLSATILDDCDEVVEESCIVESTKRDEDENVGTKSSVTILDDSNEMVEEDCSVESMKKDEEEDEVSDGKGELDEEIEAIKTMLETLAAKLEALEKKRARRVSRLELK